MIEGYDKWSIQSTDDLGGTYILELRLVRASNTRAPSIVGDVRGHPITDLFIRGLNPIGRVQRDLRSVHS